MVAAVSMLVVVIVVSGFVVFSMRARASPGTGLEECHTLVYNGDEAIDVVFFSSEQVAQEYMDALLAYKPFDEFVKNFNLHVIEEYEPECDLYKGIALLCHSRRLAKVASSCPNDYVVVVQDHPSSIRSSAYMNVLSINGRHPKSVMAHEFGHAFANFAEEYTPAKLPKGVDNCQLECSGFGGVGECHQGCSSGDAFRSAEAGVMRTLKSDHFGEFNEDLIRERLNKGVRGLTGGVIQQEGACEEQKYYLVEGTLVEDGVEITRQDTVLGCVGGNGQGNFGYQVKRADGTAVESDAFYPEFIFTEEIAGEELVGGETFDSDRPFLLKVPIIAGGDVLAVEKDGETLIEVPLGGGKRLCRIS